MKKIFVISWLACVPFIYADAQNTFPWPNTGSVGIGTNAPSALLELKSIGQNPQLKLNQSAATDFARLRFTNANENTNSRYWDIAAIIDAGNASSDKLLFWHKSLGSVLSLTGNGNVGINNSSPRLPLTFAASVGKKISLYPGNTGDMGFGVAANSLQIFADDANGEVALGFDDRGTFRERFAVKRTGALAVAGNTGVAGQVLTSNGNGAAAQWKSATTAFFQSSVSLAPPPGTPFTVLVNTAAAIPGMTDNFTLTGRAKILVNYQVLWNGAGCVLCADPGAFIDVMFDGVSVSGISIDAVSVRLTSSSGSILIPATAGSHTLSLRVTNGNAQNILIRGQVPGGTNMSRIIIPE